MEYNFKEIEQKWQQKWTESKVYSVSNDSNKESFYVLDMFPYPSGAGLHVGHPLGYIASDVYSRYKRLKGFNVLHPMGYDSFGLPAEQYAIQTGQHPAITTEQNIARYRLNGRIKLIKSDLFAGPRDRRYDLIISNPPYGDALEFVARAIDRAVYGVAMLLRSIWRWMSGS